MGDCRVIDLAGFRQRVGKQSGARLNLRSGGFMTVPEAMIDFYFACVIAAFFIVPYLAIKDRK
jgi:hypothetical protein